MEKELGILVIHGMGSQKEGFADKMIDRVNRRVAKKFGLNTDKIAWNPVFWANITEENQVGYLDRISSHNLRSFGIRNFIVKALGDAVAYQKTDSSDNHTYEDINLVMKEAMASIFQQLGEDPNKPLMILAHSLGGVIMSNYIWDTRGDNNITGFHNFETLKTIVTFGCNLPLFSFAYDEPKAIEVPGSQWFNYYDKHDILGYPLKPISESYEQAITEEEEINSGGLFTSWNPLSHSSYWTDKDFVKRVSGHINQILQ